MRPTGLVIANVNEWSSYTVTTTTLGVPKACAVAALNCRHGPTTDIFTKPVLRETEAYVTRRFGRVSAGRIRETGLEKREPIPEVCRGGVAKVQNWVDMGAEVGGSNPDRQAGHRDGSVGAARGSLNDLSKFRQARDTATSVKRLPAGCPWSTCEPARSVVR